MLRLAELVNVLRYRLETGEFHSQYLTLVIVETLVKNCGPRVHRAIASERFMNQMKAVVKVSWGVHDLLWAAVWSMGGWKPGFG